METTSETTLAWRLHRQPRAEPSGLPEVPEGILEMLEELDPDERDWRARAPRDDDESEAAAAIRARLVERMAAAEAEHAAARGWYAALSPPARAAVRAAYETTLPAPLRRDGRGESRRALWRWEAGFTAWLGAVHANLNGRRPHPERTPEQCADWLVRQAAAHPDRKPRPRWLLVAREPGRQVKVLALGSPRDFRGGWVCVGPVAPEDSPEEVAERIVAAANGRAAAEGATS